MLLGFSFTISYEFLVTLELYSCSGTPSRLNMRLGIVPTMHLLCVPDGRTKNTVYAPARTTDSSLSLMMMYANDMVALQN